MYKVPLHTSNVMTYMKEALYIPSAVIVKDTAIHENVMKIR